MSDARHDFTRGDILRQLVAFSGPIMVANLLQTSYQFIDSLWIGNLLGAEALGAVAVSSVIIFVVLAFVIGMNNAALTILSQQRGRGDEAGLQRYLNAFVVLLFLAAVGLGTAGYLVAEPLLRLLGTPAAVLAEAVAYLRITFAGIVFLFGYNFMSTVLRALGDSRTPMRFVLLAVLLNLVLDPLLIATLDLGVSGAAYATVLAQGAAFAYGVVHVARRRLVPWQTPRWPAWTETRRILDLGVPGGLQMAVISAGSAAIMSVVTSFGGQVVGGFAAAQRLDALIMLPAQAIGVSVSSMAGQNIGHGDWDRVHRIARVAVRYNLAIMIATGAVVLLLAEWAVRLFVTEPDAVAFATTYLRIIALCYPFLGINFVLNGVVRASGAMYQVLALNFVSFWVLRYPLTALAARTFGETGIAVGIGASFVASSVVAYLYFRYGRWRDKRLFDEPADAGAAPTGAGGAPTGAGPHTDGT